MIILYIILWLISGYIVSCLFERFTSDQSSTIGFLLINFNWPIVLFVMLFVLMVEMDLKIPASKLRKWIRGF